MVRRVFVFDLVSSRVDSFIAVLRHAQELRKVQGTPPGGLFDLGLATEAVGDN